MHNKEELHREILDIPAQSDLYTRNDYFVA